jgi:dihydroorotase
MVHGKQLDLNTLISKLTFEPGKIIGTRFGELGTLKPGCRADITIFDPNEEWVVDSCDFFSKGKNTPYDGYPFKGKIHMTLVSGQMVYKL